MSITVASVRSETGVHWTVSANHRLRTGAFANMFASIVLHGWDRHYSPVFWGLIALHLLVYPHLAYLRARRAAHSQQAEVDNLTLDCLLFGMLVAALAFPLWISFTVYVASMLNVTISRGLRGLARSQVAFAGGTLLGIALTGWHFDPDTAWPSTALCLLGNTVYMASIGLVAHRRNLQLRETREALRRGEQTLQAQLAEIEGLRDQLQEQVIRDPLTGLHNRRFLEGIVGRDLARCRREGIPLALMMIDVDHFKRINDTYGHPGGDLVLQRLGAHLQRAVRASDAACRYGGEEFILLLPGMPRDAAAVRADQWRESFAREVVPVEGVPVQATISMGIAFFPDHGDTLAELTRVADLALYQAKQAGHNQVVVYRPEA